MKNALLYLFLIVGLASCSSSTIEIDNPTGEKITVAIGDTKAVEIKPYGNKEISLDANDKELFVNGKSLGKLTANSSNNYLLNPTQSVYYIEENVYGEESSSAQMDMLLKNTNTDKKTNPDDISETILVFDDVLYMGRARADSSLLIKKIWDYGVHQDLPSYIKTTRRSESKRKIYREEFFIKHAGKIYRDALKSMEKE